MPTKEENLHMLLDPRSVAVVGASKNRGKLGYHVMKSLTESGFQGPVFPITRRRASSSASRPTPLFWTSLRMLTLRWWSCPHRRCLRSSGSALPKA